MKFYEGEQPGAGASREFTTKQSSHHHCLFQQGSVVQSRLQPILMSSIALEVSGHNLKGRIFFLFFFVAVLSYIFLSILPMLLHNPYNVQ